ncbi:hypothetical protein BD779DRAFT_1474486, partial [Infundibulicybe gibba]
LDPEGLLLGILGTPTRTHKNSYQDLWGLLPGIPENPASPYNSWWDSLGILEVLEGNDVRLDISFQEDGAGGGGNTDTDNVAQGDDKGSETGSDRDTAGSNASTSSSSSGDAPELGRLLGASKKLLELRRSEKPTPRQLKNIQVMVTTFPESHFITHMLQEGLEATRKVIEKDFNSDTGITGAKNMLLAHRRKRKLGGTR